MDNATVSVRPLRFVFVVEPKDKAGLQRIFETNSALWGGAFNFIVPLFKQVPRRYREKYSKTIPAKAMLKGLVEAFQPDYLIELKPGAAASHGITFPQKRILPIEEFSGRDERQRCRIGIDLRSICDDLYRTTFRFVQRHPPEVVIPSPTEKRFRLLFAATFGPIPPGRYGMGGMGNTPNPHRVPRVYLTPQPGTNRQGRDSFEVHQGRDNDSAGCITLDPDEYDRFRRFYQIDNHGDTTVQ